MPYTYPGQIFDNTLTGLKGDTSPYRLDIWGTISANVDLGGVGTPVPSGRCMHIESLSPVDNANGVATGPLAPVFNVGANLNKVPLFLWPGQSDFDVSNPGVPAGVGLGGQVTPTIVKPAHVPVFPTGVVCCLVGLGDFELETTEFDDSLDYEPNDYLRAVTRETSADGGKLTNTAATAATGAGQELGASTDPIAWGDPALSAWDSVVGQVSRGKYTNVNGRPALAFWCRSLPGTR